MGSDDILVTTTEYNSAGEAHKTIDPARREDRQVLDDAGRTTKTVQNYTDGDPSTGDSGEDVTVETAHNADAQVSTLTAKNSTVTDRIVVALSTELWLYGFGGQKRGLAELLRILEKTARAGPI